MIVYIIIYVVVYSYAVTTELVHILLFGLQNIILPDHLPAGLSTKLCTLLNSFHKLLLRRSIAVHMCRASQVMNSNGVIAKGRNSQDEEFGCR